MSGVVGLVAALALLLLAGPSRLQRRRVNRVEQHVAFLNLGRGNTAARREALVRLRRSCRPDTVVGLVEITPDELAWVRELWRGWTVIGRGQTYLVVGPELTIHWSVIRRIFRAVPRYGATRHAVRVTVSDGRRSTRRRVVVAHVPAEFGGPTFLRYFRQGQRIGWALVRRWLRGLRSILVADMNVHGTNPLPDLDDLELLFRDGYDVSIAGAPDGWTVDMRDHHLVPSDVERQHDGHTGTAVWRRTPTTSGRQAHEIR